VLQLLENVFKIFVNKDNIIVMTENVLVTHKNVQLDQSVLKKIQYYVQITNVFQMFLNVNN